MKFNKNLSITDAKERVNTLYSETKGKKNFSKKSRQVFYFGGTESFMFTRLEQHAKSEQPKTPALGAAISNSLLAENADDRVMFHVLWYLFCSF